MNYWKAKAAYLQFQLEIEQARVKAAAVFMAEGLDPLGHYEFDDAKEEARTVGHVAQEAGQFLQPTTDADLDREASCGS